MKKLFLTVAAIFCLGISVNAQNKETQCEQYYKDGKSAYDKGDYEVALIFFNRCKKEDCKNADFQIYIDACNTKLGTKNNAVVIIDNGVEINGVVWATCNVGNRGTFVPTPEDYGNYYTWEQAQNVCPSGWRLPTKEEFNGLINSGTSVWSELNGVKGCYLGSENKRVFFPFAGYGKFNVLGQGDSGCYWSSTFHNSFFVYMLYFDRDYPHAVLSYDDYYANGFTVRCVAE